MADSSSFEAVVFRVGEVFCALPAGIVREILPRLPATRIPGVAAAVEGLVNVRGTLLTVLDGLRLLGQAPAATDDGAIVVLELSGRRYGLAVSQVLDFFELPADAVASSAELPGIDRRLVRGVGTREGRHFIVLDIEALLAPIIGG